MKLLTPEAFGSRDNHKRLAELQISREEAREKARLRQLGGNALHRANVDHLPLVHTGERPQLEIPIEGDPGAAQEITVRRTTPIETEQH